MSLWRKRQIAEKVKEMSYIGIHKPFDRFEMEQQIMECWNVTTDIRTVSEYLMDAPLEEGREDKIANMLIGIEALYETKFNKLMQQFEQLVREHAKTFDQ